MFVCSGRSGQTAIKHAGFMGLGKQVCGGEVGSGWVGMANWVGESCGIRDEVDGVDG